MRASLHRLLSVLVLVAWMLPTVGALGVALHVALDHHGPHHADPSPPSREIARTLDDAHHHDLAAAVGHGHQATIENPTRVLRPATSFVAAIPAPASVDALATERRYRGGSLRRAPPDPLFRIHCSLLL